MAKDGKGWQEMARGDEGCLGMARDGLAKDGKGLPGTARDDRGSLAMAWKGKGWLMMARDG